MNRWKFPYGVDLTPSGHNNTAIEMFLDNIIDSLTREVIQNSLDAHNKSVGNPVKVVFEFTSMKTNEIPNVVQIKEALEKAKEMWTEKNSKDTLDYLHHFEETINSDEVSMLKISDYNTVGLDDKSYESLVVGNAYSEKSNEASAGSKGIGKAAPFASSNLRMVFYNTVPVHGTEKSAGVMNFVSYYKNKSENKITQERASYVDDGKTYMDRQFTFNYPVRNESEYGTDLFIIGLKQFDDWQVKILLSAINNFLVSIFKNELEIVIHDKVLNVDTLAEVIKELKELDLKRNDKSEFESTLRYYDVLTNENTLKFYLDERFEKYDFIESLEDGYLLLLDHDPANRRVLQTREAGMKIYERNRINGKINFTGVFQAVGSKLNAFLKDMENANHNIWSIDRLQDKKIKRAGTNLLSDLLRWYKDKVRESYETASEKEIEAFGISDLLPIQEKTESDAEEKDSGIRNRVNSIQIETKESKAPSRDGDKEEEQWEVIVSEVEDGPGDSSGPGSDRTGSGGGDSPGGEHGGGDEDGERGGTGEKTVGETKKQIGPSNKIRVKIIEIDASNGEYSIVGIPTKKLKKINIELKNVGADGRTYKMNVLQANSHEYNASVNKSSIDLELNNQISNFKVDFQVDSSLRSKMEATIYEVTS